MPLDSAHDSTDRPSATRPASDAEGVTRRDVLRYHLGGLAFVAPPTLVGAAYLAFIPQTLAFAPYFGGFLLALSVTFAFSIWLSDRVRGWDERDVRQTTTTTTTDD